MSPPFFAGGFFDFFLTFSWSLLIAVLLFCLAIWIRRKHFLDSSSSSRKVKVLWGLAGVAVLVRIIYVAVLGEKALILTDGYYYRAVTLYAGQGLRSPMGYPTAYFMPGYTLVLWALFHILGGPTHLAVYIAQIGFGILSMAAIYFYGKVCFDQTTGLLAAALLGWFPSEIIQGAYGLSDLSFEATLWAGVAAFLWVMTRSSQANGALTALSGLLLGFASLVRPYGLLIVVAYLAWALFVTLKKNSRFAAWPKRPALVTLILTLILYSPWVIRNYFVFKHFVPFSSCGGVNLWISNNPMASGKYENLPEEYYKPSHPSEEIAVDQKFNRIALAYIRENPAHFVRRIPTKWLFLFGSDSTTLGQVLDHLNARNHAINNFLAGVANGFYLALFALSVSFGATHFSSLVNHPGRSFGLVLLVFFLIAFSFYHVQTRYHMPLLPAICILAAAFLRHQDADPGL